MKKGACALLVLVASCPAWSLDWLLPIVTVRYEIAGGGVEDPDNDTLEPSSLRNTMTLRIKEEADPAVFGLAFTVSQKDYYQQSGDYSYLKVEHDASLRVSDPWKLGYVLGAKAIRYPEPDAYGLSKDALSLNVGGTTAVRLGTGSSLEAGVSGRFLLAENATDARQAWGGNAGISARMGDWLFSARYRGEFRFPLGTAATAGLDMYHVGSVSVQWDPN
jgi:hypothetical protein